MAVPERYVYYSLIHIVMMPGDQRRNLCLAPLLAGHELAAVYRDLLPTDLIATIWRKNSG